MTRVEINFEGIAAMKRDLQEAFDRSGPIRIPVFADVPEGLSPGGITINNFGDGPVVQGDGAQIAYGNQHVTQTFASGHDSRVQTLIEAVRRILEVLPDAGLDADDHAAAARAADDLLAEASIEQPDTGRVRKALTLLKGHLAPLAIALSAGATHGAGSGADQAAREAIEHLIHIRW